MSDDVKELAAGLRDQASGEFSDHFRIRLMLNDAATVLESQAVQLADLRASLWQAVERLAGEAIVAERQRADALRNELTGSEKARALLNAGMESQCELMDAMKQRLRAMGAALKPFAEYARRVDATVPLGDNPVWPDSTGCNLWFLNDRDTANPTLGDCRKAREVLGHE